MAARAARTSRPPTRSCVACRTSREKRDLLRVVRDPGGNVILDPTSRANGRGAYVCRDEACIATAIDRGALGRALEAPLPADLRAVLVAAAGHGALIGGAHGQE